MSDLLIFLVPPKPLLTQPMLERLANIMADIGQVSLASIAIPIFIDKGSLLGIVLGYVASKIKP